MAYISPAVLMTLEQQLRAVQTKPQPARDRPHVGGGASRAWRPRGTRKAGAAAANNRAEPPGFQCRSVDTLAACLTGLNCHGQLFRGGPDQRIFREENPHRRAGAARLIRHSATEKWRTPWRST